MKILDKEVNRIGMGCWAIGGPFFAGELPLGFGETDDAESRNTIRAAIDCGVKLFDTAAVYGAGHSEELLGETLKHSDDVLVVTKLGMSFDRETKRIGDDQTDASSVLPAIEASLKRLQRDSLDIILLHLNDLPFEAAEPLFEEMEKARQSGKVRGFGWSTDFSDSVSALAANDDLKEGFVAVQHAMNVFVDTPKIQENARNLGLTALLRSPLAMGVLSGKFTAASKLPAHDHRSTPSDWRDYFDEGKVSPQYLEKLEKIRELLCFEDRTIAQGSLCWLLAKSDHNLPIPGARTVAQITENAKAAEFGPLPDGIMDEIETLIDRPTSTGDEKR